MSSIPEGMRQWKCPECGTTVLLPITQLDPMACDACLAKMKTGRRSSSTADSSKDSPPVGVWNGLPEAVKAALVIVALILGGGVGFVAGRMTAPKPAPVIHESSHSQSRPHTEPVASESAPDDAPAHELKEPRPAPPGPGYKWVSGRLRKDGTRGEGHWAKDPRYKENATEKP